MPDEPADNSTLNQTFGVPHGNDTGTCSSQPAGASCGAENNFTDCANGQRCVRGSCADLQQGTPCGDDKQCGLRQTCEGGKCRGDYMRAGMVVNGASCIGTHQCGDEQRCVHNHCSLTPPGTRCASNGDCGNGQLCTGNSCANVAFGTPCEHTDAQCANCLLYTSPSPRD